ncbi:AAA family ATPase [Humisphaera borealis]|uniref:MoxR family ATPase n=1 Tax=Humisphaera borealis TaxID=2807512 RepID=A0A7M2WQW7_9BACT|nr:MoxR family ATPase [Humisphaera borealis]QOV87866.1 MoxR family ATPase [Humisphaera borealis]
MRAPADKSSPPTGPNASDVQAAKYLSEIYHLLQHELSKVIVGQEKVLEEILIAVFARGHCLMQGVPGLAKTLLVSTIGQTMELAFRRIQFTPDLMPSDITGTDILQEDPDTGRRRFEFVRGPIFTNLLLADEINRTPPKTQAALLQAMQERTVTAGSHTMDLPDPFFVLATQNPIEQEGTYPLPEAQLDRFMFMVIVNYPKREEELEVLKRTTGSAVPRVKKIIDAKTIVELQEIVRRVPVGDHVYNFALDLVRATRPNEPTASDFVRHWLSWGAGPRAGQYLILAGKARALMRGRLHVTVEDIEAVAAPVLRHRIIPNFNADAEGISVEQIVEKIITLIPRGKGERLL